MKKSRLSSLALSLLLLPSVFAQGSSSPWTITRQRLSRAPECIANPNDPFEIGARGTEGVDAGNCRDQKVFRPVVLLTQQERLASGFAAQPANGKIVVANVSDSNGFSIAEIPLNKIVETRLLVQNFDIGFGVLKVSPGHVMIRYLFSEDVVLRTQTLGQPVKEKHVRDLYFSAHTHEPYVLDAQLPTKVVDGSYAFAMGVFTFDGKFADDPMTFPVEQWHIQLPVSTMADFATRYIALSSRILLSTHYHLVENNCASVLFKLFDRMLTYTPAQKNEIVKHYASDYIPTQSPPAFEARGIFNVSTDKLRDLNDEVGRRTN